jgi:hypothetical protein
MKRARIRAHSESEFEKWGRLAEKRRNQESRFKSLQSFRGTSPLSGTMEDVTECFTILSENGEKVVEHEWLREPSDRGPKADQLCIDT